MPRATGEKRTINPMVGDLSDPPPAAAEAGAAAQPVLPLPVPAPEEPQQRLQQVGEAAPVVEIIPHGALRPGSLSDALATIHGVRDVTGMILLRAGANSLQSDRGDLKTTNRELLKELRTAEQQVAVERTSHAVLRERLQSVRHVDKLRVVLAFRQGVEMRERLMLASSPRLLCDRRTPTAQGLR